MTDEEGKELAKAIVSDIIMLLSKLDFIKFRSVIEILMEYEYPAVID